LLFPLKTENITETGNLSIELKTLSIAALSLHLESKHHFQTPLNGRDKKYGTQLPKIPAFNRSSKSSRLVLTAYKARYQQHPNVNTFKTGTAKG